MRRAITLAALLAAAPLTAHAAEAGLPLALKAQIDRGVAAALKANDCPSASIAVVKDGRIAYAKAYGKSRLSPPLAASNRTRYQIASISKEIVAAAALILQQDGKLSLDDKVSRWLPDLTDADKITVRQVLTHTAGYSDYWPQDYLMAPMARPTTPQAILDGWAKKPLDFKPGEDWQYSNTGYVVAGRIIEKASGQPLYAFIQQRIFTPLHITDAVDADATPLISPDAIGYERAALGPLRPSPYEGKGWLYAAGQLGLTAEDLAKWDVSLLDRTLLKPESYTAEFTPVKLNSGRDSGYALGLQVGKDNGRTFIHHGGEGSGFLAENRIYPDDKVAIVVLTNTISGSAQTDIADRLAYLVLPPKGLDPKVRALFEGLQHGKVDRSAFTENFNGYLDAKTVADYARSLGPLGEPTSFKARREGDRGGMKFHSYHIIAGGKPLDLTIYVMPDGKIEQFLIYAATS